MRLMQRIRDAIKNECFPEFVVKFIRNYYAKCNYPPNNANSDSHGGETVSNKFNIPDWVVNALNAVSIDVLVEAAE